MRRNSIPGLPADPSVICLGTSGYGSGLTQEESFRLLDLYLELGGNFLDTANVYDDWLGMGKSTSERTLGAWMKSRGNRNRVVLATKGAHPELAAMHVPRLGREEIVHDLNQSLGHLQTDRIDLYWLHRDDPARPVEEIVETLNDQVQAGKILAFGCSNWSVGRIEAANRYAAARGMSGFAASQPLWNLAVFNRSSLGDPTLVLMDGESLDYYKEKGMPVVPYSSQANGFFSGRYAKEQEAGGEGRAETVRAHYFNDASFGRLERVRRLAAELGTTGTRIALAYLTSQPFPVFPIVGCLKEAYLRDSCTAGDLMLTPEQLEYLEG